LVAEANAARASAADPRATRKAIADAASAIHARADRLAVRLLPGVVPPRAPGLDELGSLRDGIARIEHAERESSAIQIELVTGLRDGQPVAVRMLRIGSGLAWWVALDRSAAGTARTHDGALILDVSDDEVAGTIIAAVGMAAGQQVPELAPLPVHAPEVRE
jgi:hypothetical protein